MTDRTELGTLLGEVAEWQAAADAPSGKWDIDGWEREAATACELLPRVAASLRAMAGACVSGRIVGSAPFVDGVSITKEAILAAGEKAAKGEGDSPEIREADAKEDEEHHAGPHGPGSKRG